ncbi:putative oxidoreductase YdgJ [Limihaloglobus sulfuriphilus]|uniref:Putative oxidoreductase YdgJ n=1 Tax=Limihaloglobus sulfuriphilus TaxID=1851148 RepID=A0A1Q2MIN2_9BACT|nr:Gfo/Idh/MocA family oxidoreductase [Limihaloglobus sulfuriphilus]AQQ72378.1 putative oxidoreductase YdgJ [Limihaloglobus sulfuriphilus]
MNTKPQVCIVGGGMITQVQILPSLYHLQRQGIIGDISVCALDSGPLRVLAEDQTLKKAFPGQTFAANPSLDTEPNEKFPELYKQILADMPEQSIVAVAMPDQLHYPVIKEAISCGHHIMCVKPLVLKYKQAIEIEKIAYEKGLVIGVEYHKRLDDRALLARRQYRDGMFGEFKIGHAEMNEPYYYRNSNFQNWCTCENSDMFTYVGCHYVDQLHFITGLMPKSVSVYGIKDKYPNGNDGYLWTDARVLWDNGACLHVTDIMGYPDEGPGGNFQGIRMYFAGEGKSGMLVHNDQFRGIEHCYLEKGCEPGDTYYSQPSPDYFKFVSLGGKGLVPVGYGYRSIELIIKNACRCIGKDLDRRQQIINELDDDGVMATPKNSSYNELVMEAGRLSILNGGREVEIEYGENAGVKLK